MRKSKLYFSESEQELVWFDLIFVGNVWKAGDLNIVHRRYGACSECCWCVV